MTRSLLRPHVGLPTPAGTNTVLHYKCAEGSALSPLVDELTNYDALVTNSPLNVTGLFVTPESDHARSFDGTSQYARHGGDSDARDAAKGEWSIVLVCRPDSVTGLQTLFHVGGDDGDTSDAENFLAQVSLSGQQVRWFWEETSGADVTGTTTGAKIDVGKNYLIAVTKKQVVGGYDVSVYIYEDGAGLHHSETWSAQTNATGGGNAFISVGAANVDVTPNNYFDGTIDEVLWTTFPYTEDGVRTLYAETFGIDHDEASVLASGFFDERFRVWMEDQNGELVNLDELQGLPWVLDASAAEDVDDQGRSASFTMHRAFFQYNAGFFADDSPLNVGGEFVQVMRRVRIETAIVPIGTDVGGEGDGWSTVFDGFTQSFSFDGEMVAVDCFDLGRALQVTWIRPSGAPPVEPVYGSPAGTAVETVMQSILDDNEPATGYKSGVVSLYTPTSPAWLAKEFVNPSTRHVLQTLEDIAGQLGWLVGYRWDDEQRRFRLTLYEPDRNAAPSGSDPVIAKGEIIDVPRSIEADDSRIINVWECEYSDFGSLDLIGFARRAVATATDATSIGDFGERAARIGIGSTGQIDNLTQAQDLVDNALLDTKDPKANVIVDTFYRPDIEIGDLVKVEADDEYFHNDETLAVISVEHAVAERRSTFTLRAATPIGKQRKWWDLMQREGFSGGRQFQPPKQPANLAIAELQRGLAVSWDPPVNNLNRLYAETEIHASSTSGFTPSAATLVALSRKSPANVFGLSPDATRYVKVVHRDQFGNRSSDSAQGSGRPRYMPPTPAFHAYRNSDDLGITADQAMNYSHEVYDLEGDFSLVDDEFTAPVEGIYRFEAVTNVDDPDDAALAIQVDTGSGYTTKILGDSVPGTGAAVMRVQGQLYLDEGDTVRVLFDFDKNSPDIRGSSDEFETYFAGALVAQLP